jgi:ABC-type polysaccharide/polyol phosphate transport system ATPase subunit
MASIIGFSGLEKFIDQPLRTYSSGMGARLGFSIASAVNPEILLIDEVLSVGDQEFRERSMNRILEMVKESGTVVVVSHNFNILRQVSTKILLLDKGKMLYVGSPERAIEKYKLASSVG